MNDVKVKIDFISPSVGNIRSRFTPQGNKITPSNINAALQGFYGGAKPLLLGVSKLSSGDTFWAQSQKYNGFMDNNFTSANGVADCTIIISGTSIDNFIFMFDAKAEQWATEIIVNGELYQNKGVQFVWTGSEANRHTIKIVKWNMPFYPVRVTSISLGLSTEFDRASIKDIVRGYELVTDNNQPTYAVISQYGEISIFDYDGELTDLDEMGILTRGQRVEISIDDEIIGKYYSEKWSVDSGIAKVELTDELLKWQDLLFEGYALKENETARTIFTLLNSKIKNIIKCSETNLAFLSTIKIKYNYLAPTTLADGINKLCDIAQIIVFQKENGEIWAERI